MGNGSSRWLEPNSSENRVMQRISLNYRSPPIGLMGLTPWRRFLCCSLRYANEGIRNACCHFHNVSHLLLRRVSFQLRPKTESIFCQEESITHTFTHTHTVSAYTVCAYITEQCIVKQSHHGELLQHDSSDKNVFPCPWRPSSRYGSTDWITDLTVNTTD